MGKPPTTDQELTARVAQLEQRADATDAELATLDARVTALEELVTTGQPPAGAHPDHELPRPPVRPDHTLPEPEPPDIEPPEPPPAGTLRVTIALAGVSYVFNEADGTDLGSYADPDGRFSERCTRVTHTDTPLRLDFRRMEGRTSVVFAQGYWSDTSHLNLPGYAATIEGDELPSLVAFAVPSHAAYQRTRWCSAPWPLPLRKMDELYDRKLLPRFDPTLTRGTDASYGHVSYSPMGLAGLTGYMPQTGGRGDIGHVTTWQGWFICHEDDAASLNDVLAQGEAAGTFNWDFADPDTGAVIDPIEHYPQATLYNASVGAPFITYSSGSSYVGATISGPAGKVLSPNGSPPAWCYLVDANRQQYRVPVDLTIPDSGEISATFEVLGSNEPAYGAASIQDYGGNTLADCTAEILDGTYAPGSGITLDSAHMPACSYLPFLLTGDPYHLENLQRQAAFIVMENPSAPVRSYGMAQPRAAGWSGRTLASCAKVSPESPPSWLLPRSVFLKAINDWANNFVYPETVQNSAPNRTVLHLVSSGYVDEGEGAVSVQPYQEDICHGGWSWLALLHPDTKWPEIVHWQCHQTIARCDGQSGWSCEYPTAYNMKALPSAGAPAFGSWSECWAANAGQFGTTADDVVTEVPVPGVGDYDYWTHMSASMAIAWQAGCVENEAALSRLLTSITDGLEQGGGRAMECNRCIAGPA